ncbi:hypothetical protein C8R45DRAFT_972386 [Mycena sanguinolenta]|nr:hypothetical protein C8R45DRAFT_972386 [Mycena sanguinolenta]
MAGAGGGAIRAGIGCLGCIRRCWRTRGRFIEGHLWACFRCAATYRYPSAFVAAIFGVSAAAAATATMDGTLVSRTWTWSCSLLLQMRQSALKPRPPGGFGLCTGHSAVKSLLLCVPYSGQDFAHSRIFQILPRPSSCMRPHTLISPTSLSSSALAHSRICSSPRPRPRLCGGCTCTSRPRVFLGIF